MKMPTALSTSRQHTGVRRLVATSPIKKSGSVSGGYSLVAEMACTAKKARAASVRRHHSCL